MDKTQSLQNLLNNTATEEDIELLKRLLASGEISIGGNVNQSVIIIGSGNTVELPPAALDRLNAHPMLGNLDRDLTGEEIAAGLRRLDKLLPNRAPVLLPHYKEQVGRLRPTLKTEIKSLSETSRRERLEALAAINSICVEALDVSFNGLALGEEAPKYDARSPFRGLESFRPEDSEFFFGREALTRKLVAQIQAHPFLAVLGASGSGKSSLVMAGVIPVLDSDYVIFRPGTNPLDELESARGKSLIVVDQFEELFTLTRDESIRKEFIARLLDESSRARIILTLRSDFLGEVGAYRALSAEIQNHLEIIPPMDLDELRRAMEGQAGVVGLRFEADLSQQILDDVAGEPGAMPLLQHALWELWNRRHGRNLRASEYRAFGGVKQAITSTAEKVYADCSKPEQDTLHDIFLRLTRLDEGDEGRDTRRRVPLSDLIPSGRDTASITLLLDKLANARLIVKTVNDDKTEVEVAHEALIRHWERLSGLRGWLNENRDNLRLRESVSEDARRWENAGRDESMLNHRGGRLDDALTLGEGSRYGLTEIERMYLNACVGLRNREQREQEQRLRWTIFALIVTAVVFLSLAGFGWLKSNESILQANEAAAAQVKAEEQAKVALARQLAAQAQSFDYSSNELQSDLLAIQSIKMINSVSGYRMLRQSFENRPIKKISINHGSYVSLAKFNNDGTKVVSASRNGTIYVWNTNNGDLLFSAQIDKDIYAADFNFDSKWIVSGGEDHVVRVWDIESGKNLSSLKHDESITDVEFGRDGKTIMSASKDGGIFVWSGETGQIFTHVTHKVQRFVNADFSPDNKFIASSECEVVCSDTTCFKCTIRVWDIDNATDVFAIESNTPFTNVMYTSGGEQLITASENRIYILNAKSGKQDYQLDNSENVSIMALSPDGQRIAAAGSGNIFIWDIASQKQVSTLAYGDTPYSMSFNSDGTLLVAGGYRTSGVWNVAQGNKITLVSGKISGITWVPAVAFDPKNPRVLVGWGYGDVDLYDVPQNNAVVGQLPKNNIVLREFFTNDNEVYVLLETCNTPDPFIPKCLDGDLFLKNLSKNQFVLQVNHLKSVAVVSKDSGIFLVPSELEISAYTSQGVLVSSKKLDKSILALGISSDGNLAAHIDSNNEVVVWNLSNGDKNIFTQTRMSPETLTFSPNDKFLTIQGRNGIEVWDVSTGVLILSSNSPIMNTRFTLDSQKIVVAEWPGVAKIYDLNNGKLVFSVSNGENINTGKDIYDMEITTDNILILSGCGRRDHASICYKGIIKTWDLKTGENISTIFDDIGYGFPVIYISPNQKWAAAVSKVLTIWDIETGRQIAQFAKKEPIVEAKFVSDDRILYVDKGGNVYVDFWYPEKLIIDVCSRLPRNLTREEWNQYIGDALPYQAVCPNLPIEPEATRTSTP